MRRHMCAPGCLIDCRKEGGSEVQRSDFFGQALVRQPFTPCSPSGLVPVLDLRRSLSLCSYLPSFLPSSLFTLLLFLFPVIALFLFISISASRFFLQSSLLCRPSVQSLFFFPLTVLSSSLPLPSSLM
mmetsp:Transcript_2396/g.5056  ORF Transcript_2396/g.5056 Transcript_2396/m.5056 type:complete len:128 (+) Transcript_2396:975-1358(+)